MLDEVCETFGSDRKHAIKALDGRVSLGRQAGKRGKPRTCGPGESEVVLALWRLSKYPSSARLRALVLHWLPYWKNIYGRLERHQARDADQRPDPDPQRQRQFRPARLPRGRLHLDGGSDRRPHAMFRGPGGTDKGQHRVVAAISDIDRLAPLDLLGFDSDNGSEFLNRHPMHYRRRWGRSSPTRPPDAMPGQAGRTSRTSPPHPLPQHHLKDQPRPETSQVPSYLAQRSRLKTIARCH